MLANMCITMYNIELLLNVDAEFLSEKRGFKMYICLFCKHDVK